MMPGYARGHGKNRFIDENSSEDFRILKTRETKNSREELHTIKSKLNRVAGIRGRTIMNQKSIYLLGVICLFFSSLRVQLPLL